jgi:hypothetical protein
MTALSASPRGKNMSISPNIIPSPECERWLTQHVPYRIKMLQGPDAFVSSRGRRGKLEPVFPSIFESALISCRWSGNFLGLGLTKGVLAPAKRSYPTDVFSIDLGGTLVDPSSLTAKEKVLLECVLRGANVATAHPTREGIHPWNDPWGDVRKAAPLLIQQIKLHLYDVLGMRAPAWKRPKMIRRSRISGWRFFFPS